MTNKWIKTIEFIVGNEHHLTYLKFASTNDTFEHLVFEVHADLLLKDNVQLLVHTSSKTFTLVHLTRTFEVALKVF